MFSRTNGDGSENVSLGSRTEFSRKLASGFNVLAEKPSTELGVVDEEKAASIHVVGKLYVAFFHTVYS